MRDLNKNVSFEHECTRQLTLIEKLTHYSIINC